MKWQTTWLLIRDVLVTGTGLVLILSQVFTRSPSDVLIAAGVTLTTPSLLAHAPAALSGRRKDGHGEPESSPRSPSAGELPPPSSSSSSSEGDGDGDP